MVQHIYSPAKEQVTVILTKLNKGVYTFTKDNLPEYLDFEDLLTSLKGDLTEEAFVVLLDAIEKFKANGKGEVTYNEETKEVSLNDEVLPKMLLDRYAAMIKEGLDVTPLKNFMENIKLNTSKDIKEELFLFLEANKLPLTEDGCFLAYKYVNNDYTDCYTGRIDNSIDKKVTMPIEKVDKDRQSTCSTGLHFTSRDYALDCSGSSNRIMVLKVNPKDVMAIPYDYNNQKGRSSEYLVVDELQRETEVIPDNFVKDDSEVKESIEKTKTTKIKTNKKRTAMDYLTKDSASFENVQWKMPNGNLVKGFKVIEVPADKDWKDALDKAKKLNPEVSKLFDCTFHNRINKGQEVAKVDRTLLMATHTQIKKDTSFKELPKAKLSIKNIS